MGRLTPALILVFLVAVPAAAQVPENPAGPILDDLVGTVVPPGENTTGQDLTSEDIRLDILLDVYNAEFGLVGIIFGGGSVRADVRADAVLEFRAIGMERLDAAVQAATGDVNATVSNTFGIPAHRLALTAEEVRLVGAGALLQMFQDYQAEATKRLLEETVPGMTVLSTAFSWSNTLPGAWAEGSVPAAEVPGVPTGIEGLFPGVDLREPPLRLDATARLQYLHRTSLFGILEGALADAPAPDEKDRLKESLKENETLGFQDRNAFEVIGFGQLLAFDVPPGWSVDVQMVVPDGFTIEGATDELMLRPDRRAASYALDGSSRESAVQQAGLVTLSSRFLVTTTLLVATLVAGHLLRVPLEMGVMTGAYRSARRRGEDVERESMARRAMRRIRRLRPAPK